MMPYFLVIDQVSILQPNFLAHGSSTSPMCQSTANPKKSMLLISNTKIFCVMVMLDTSIRTPCCPQYLLIERGGGGGGENPFLSYPEKQGG